MSEKVKLENERWDEWKWVNEWMNEWMNKVPCSWLFSEEVHDVRCKLVAALVVLLNLLLVDGPDLRQLGLVVRMLDGCAAVLQWARGSSFVGAWNPHGTAERLLDRSGGNYREPNQQLFGRLIFLFQDQAHKQCYSNNPYYGHPNTGNILKRNSPAFTRCLSFKKLD